MKAVLLLGDAAQVDPSGKAHVIGLGWSVTTTPTPPIALLLIVEVPWDQTNVKHQVSITLVDGDGHQAVLGLDEVGAPVNFSFAGEVETGRPPGTVPGSPQLAQLAINLGGGIPLVPGVYEFRVEIDGQPSQDGPSARFTVTQAQGQPA